MKKIILIGKSGSGKTTLIQRIENRAIQYRKTQSVQSTLHFIDTPGEYLENRAYYKALIVSSADADIIGLVHACGGDESWLPPLFSSAFSKEVVGIVTKTDLAATAADIRKAEQALQKAGAQRMFRVSATQNTGITQLAEFIQQS